MSRLAVLLSLLVVSLFVLVGSAVAQTLVAVPPPGTSFVIPGLLILLAVLVVGGGLYLKIKRPDLWARITRATDKAQEQAGNLYEGVEHTISGLHDKFEPASPPVAPVPSPQLKALLDASAQYDAEKATSGGPRFVDGRMVL